MSPLLGTSTAKPVWPSDKLITAPSALPSRSMQSCSQHGRASLVEIDRGLPGEVLRRHHIHFMLSAPIHVPNSIRLNPAHALLSRDIATDLL